MARARTVCASELQVTWICMVGDFLVTTGTPGKRAARKGKDREVTVEFATWLEYGLRGTNVRECDTWYRSHERGKVGQETTCHPRTLTLK